MNEMSGFKNKIINAGNIQNSGIELMINARPVETADFSWDRTINFSKNNNKVLELGPGIPKYELGGAAEFKVYAVAGGNYGEIWGTRFARVEDVNSPYYGKLILMMQVFILPMVRFIKSETNSLTVCWDGTIRSATKALL